MSSFSGELLRLSTFRETIKVELSQLLSRVGKGNHDSKILFIAPHILSAFDALGISKDLFTQDCGVIGVIPFGKDDGMIFANHAVYLLNPDVENLRPLVISVLAYAQRYPKSLIHVFFVPRKPLMAEHVLENEFKLLQSLPELQLGEFDLDLVPFDDDICSMQQPLSFKHLFSDGDITLLQWTARMLLKLQTSRFGPIPLIRGKGNKATKVIKMLNRMQIEVGSDFFTDLTPQIDSLFILDRSIDLLTPMVTQLTYEGLIDEFYGVDSGHVTLPFSLGESSKVALGQRILLNNNDRMFKEVRDKNFATVGSVLYNKSIWVKQSYEKRKEVQQLKELKEFMKGLPEMQELHRLIGVHTAIATEIGKKAQSMEFRQRVMIEQSIIQQINDREVLDYIEEQINKGSPITEVLRLISMYSVVNGGLKAKTYEFFKEIIMLSYGIPQIMSALFCLERCGLVTKNDGKQFNYGSIRKQLKLWNESLQEQQPNDIAYAYSGYAPLSVRLFESMIAHPESWNTTGGVIDMVPGEKTEICNEVEVPGSTRISLVLIIGGITRAEMSALRYVQTKLSNAGQPRHIVILATDITNGNLMVKSLLPFTA